MALINDSRIYSGGNVQFDPSPTINMYAQLLQKKQAKQEAIDEYYRKLPGTLNSAGMRDQDIEGFNNELLSLQQKYNRNKAAIQKGTTPEALDYDQHFRRIAEGVVAGKNAAKTDLTLGTMRIKGENEYIFEDPNFMESHKSHTLSVWDKNHKALDLGTIAVPPKPLDAEAQNKIWNTITNGIKAIGKEHDESRQTTNPVTMLTAVPYVKKFKADQIAGIAENMRNLAKTDRSVKAHFNKVLLNADEKTLNTFAQAYSAVHPDVKVNQNGKTLTISQFWAEPTPEKVAEASAIIRASVPQEEGEDYKPAKELIMNKAADIALSRQKTMEGIRQGNRIQLTGIRRAYQVADQETQDEYVKEIVAAYKRSGTVDPQIVSDYQKADGKGHKVPIDKQIFNADGTVDFIVYKLDKKGNATTEVDETYSTKGVPQSQIEARTRKELETPMTNTKGTNQQKKPTGKTYKVGNTTLTEEQLIKGAKKYNMTVEQYKKSIGL